jgi:hypothetical protein
MATENLQMNTATIEVPPVTASVVNVPYSNPANKIPCDWHIVAIDDGMVMAVNRNSLDTFEGLPADLKKIVRG